MTSNNRFSNQNPVPLVRAVAEALVITTGAGAIIGGHLGAPKVGAVVGLATGCAVIFYWSRMEIEPYAAFALSHDSQNGPIL